MLGMVYWQGDLPPRYQLAMNVGTLLGSMIGQVLFGILADLHGRRKMYGLELVITIVASLSFAAASPGVNNSMSLIGWLIFWRIIMGIGIGILTRGLTSCLSSYINWNFQGRITL